MNRNRRPLSGRRHANHAPRRGPRRALAQQAYTPPPTPVSDVILLDVAPIAESLEGELELGTGSDLGFVDQAPGASGSFHFPRVVTPADSPWAGRNPGRRCEQFYPTEATLKADAARIRTTRRARRRTRRTGRPSHRATDLQPRPPEPRAGEPARKPHSERWSKALSEAGVPVCWVCDTQNPTRSRECTRCGQRLVSAPGADSSILEAIPTRSTQWGAVHSVCVAAALLLGSGVLLLM